jgi:hypothetical protein
MSDRTTLVNFVARGKSPDEWKMVLVEEGPWVGPIKEQLTRVQDRLYGCVDAVLDGQLAEQFPDTKGKNVVVQLDCYNLPKAEVTEFFDRFSDGVLKLPDYRDALAKSKFIKGISFELNFNLIN